MSENKNIYTLIPDILNVIREGKEPSQENLDLFASDCVESLRDALKSGCSMRAPTIRMSNVGTPYRKMWFDFHSDIGREEIHPTLAITFMYGHIVEAFMLLLARHAGHSVTRQQEEVKLEGIVGHIDSFIDGVLVDVKSVSQFNFDKFDKDKLFYEDDYGYIAQISGYAKALGQRKAYFFAFDKSRCRMALLEVKEHQMIDAEERINKMKVIISNPDEPPKEMCYNPVPQNQGKNQVDNGNRVLAKGCQWCEYKEECWKDSNNGKGLRAFQYSNKVEYFTHIEKEPTRVMEIKKDAQAPKPQDIDSDFSFL